MKIILSRKGTDSSYGGYPSPILPDGSLLSIPIPSMRFAQKKSDIIKKWQYFDGNSYSPTKYRNLKIPPHIKESLLTLNLNFETYEDLLIQLLPKARIKEKVDSKIQWFDFSVPWYCHLDPDIIPDVLPREKMWRPIFGQVNIAQRHLEKQGVGKNDLFLFFGWFRKTKIIKEKGEPKLRYDSSDSKGTHIIYGYFQVDEVLKKEDKSKIESWMKPHPHLGKGLWNTPNNALYIAQPKLSWNEKYVGAGYFKFHDDLLLTETNLNRNPKQNRSIWKYSFIPQGTDITYHNTNSWIEENNKLEEVIRYFKSTECGQEFVIKNCPELENKIKKWTHFNNVK